ACLLLDIEFTPWFAGILPCAEPLARIASKAPFGVKYIKSISPRDARPLACVRVPANPPSADLKYVADKTDDQHPGGKEPSDIRPISIAEEMKRSYLEYALSVIV